MSGKIDYDELDRAVSRASKSSQAKTKSAASKDFIAEKQSYTPRTRYMDFIARPRKKATAKASEPKPIKVTTKPAPSAVQPQAPRRVARFAPASAGMPNYRVASSHPATKPHSVPVNRVAQPAPIPAVKPIAHTAKPAPITKTPARPATKPAVRVASAKPTVAPKPAAAPKTALSEAEKIQAKNTAAAANAAAKALEKAPSSPNANNYSLGVRSPFIRNDAKVEKRPLGSGSEYVQDDKVGKNTYEPKAEKASPAKNKKTKVAKSKKPKNNGWIWPLIIVLIIAAGGGLGYLAYRVLENAF